MNNEQITGWCYSYICTKEWGLDWEGEIERDLLPYTEHTLFSSPHRTLSKIDHILGHRRNLTNFKEFFYRLHFSGHNEIKLENSSGSKTIIENLKYLDLSSNTNIPYQNLWDENCTLVLKGHFFILK